MSTVFSRYSAVPGSPAATPSTKGWARNRVVPVSRTGSPEKRVESGPGRAPSVVYRISAPGTEVVRETDNSPMKVPLDTENPTSPNSSATGSSAATPAPVPAAIATTEQAATRATRNEQLDMTRSPVTQHSDRWRYASTTKRTASSRFTTRPG